MINVGIIGCGFVGGALKDWLEHNNPECKLFISDPPKGYNDDLSNIDIAFLRNATFKEEFSGTTIPEKYSRDTDHLLERAKGFLLMFKNIENCTYFSEEINY